MIEYATAIERDAREAKAAALAAVLYVGGIAAGQVPAISEQQWKILARIAGVEPPHSEQTISIVFGALCAEPSFGRIFEHKSGIILIRPSTSLPNHPTFFVTLSAGAWPPQDEIIEACIMKFATARMLFLTDDQAVVLATLPRKL